MKAKLEHNLRLYSGLYIAFFLVLHLLNAALGLVSIAAMDKLGSALYKFWSIPLFGIFLYASFAVHIGLMFISLYRRRTLRLPFWNLIQIALGLLLPWLLINHIIGTRGNDFFLDIQRNYTHVVTGLWSDNERIIRQVALVLIAWTHMSVGIHFWLRYKQGYRSWLPVLYPLGLLLPVLAIMGFIRAGVESENNDAAAAAFNQVRQEVAQADPAIRSFLQNIGDQVLWVFGLMLISLLLLRLIRDHINVKRGGFSIFHTGVGKTLKGRRGQSVLGALREAKIPHASVCGGRGRCTTCRVRVTQSGSALPAPNALEASALERLGSEPNVRLACQIRPLENISITPLLKPSNNVQASSLQTGVVGHEQQVVCMFVDMRDSTKLGEQKLPFDVVFILNQFFIQLSDALNATKGHYASFTGDGLMALYGLRSGLEAGSRDALNGAVEIERRIVALNEWLSDELAHPLQIGIGIHSGEAIVGTMGPPDAPVLSAIGDTINIAARLEALTKNYKTLLVVSDVVLQQAGVVHSDLPKYTETVRGRGKSLDIVTVDEPSKLRYVSA